MQWRDNAGKVLKPRVKGNKAEKAGKEKDVMDKSSACQQGPFLDELGDKCRVVARHRIYVGGRKKETQSRICKIKISPYSKGRKGKNVIKLHSVAGWKLI